MSLFCSHDMFIATHYTEYILQTTRSNDDIANISKDDRPLGKGKRYYIWYDLLTYILQLLE